MQLKDLFNTEPVSIIIINGVFYEIIVAWFLKSYLFWSISYLLLKIIASKDDIIRA